MDNYRTLSPTLAKKAKDELNEDSNRNTEEIEIVRNWIHQQLHLKARIDAQYLLNFLRGCKHNLEKTKEKLDNFYSLRSSLPELYGNRFVDDPKLVAIRTTGSLIRLPHTNGDDGPRIFITRLGAYDPKKNTINDLFRLVFMLNDISLMEDDNAFVAGHIELFDLNNVTAHHFFELQLLVIKKWITFSEKSFPVRLKGTHIFNVPAGFDTIFNIIRSFLSEDRKKRFFIHGSMQSLYKHVPQHLLPVEYGGSCGCIQDIVDNWEKTFLKYRDFFIEDNTLGSDEKLRIGEPLNPDSVFGISGTFRKLDID